MELTASIKESTTSHVVIEQEQSSSELHLKKARPQPSHFHLKRVKFIRTSPLKSENRCYLLDDSLRKVMWYQATDLLRFCQENEENNIETDKEVRSKRLKLKRLTRKSIVLAHKRGMKDDELGVIARRCSKGPEKIALVQGCKDYLSAYGVGEKNNSLLFDPLSKTSSGT